MTAFCDNFRLYSELQRIKPFESLIVLKKFWMKLPTYYNALSDLPLIFFIEFSTKKFFRPIVPIKSKILP